MYNVVGDPDHDDANDHGEAIAAEFFEEYACDEAESTPETNQGTKSKSG